MNPPIIQSEPSKRECQPDHPFPIDFTRRSPKSSDFLPAEMQRGSFMPKVAFIQGGGIGIDQEASVRKVLAALRVPVEFEVFPAGRAALEQGKDALPAEALEAVKRCGLALKTKLLPAADPAKATRNFNVDFRHPSFREGRRGQG